MTERKTTYVEDFALDDYFLGTQVGLEGDAQGFEVGALIRFPAVTDDARAGGLQELVWGAGDLSAATPNGWAIFTSQVNNTTWQLNFVISTLLGTVTGITFNWNSIDLPANFHTLWLHAIWSPDVSPLGIGAGSGMALYMNGQLVQAITKVSYRPALAPPAIGNTVLAGPIGAPHVGVSAVSYAQTDPGFALHYGEVYKQITAMGDLRQLPAGQFQWDNIFSARRGMPNVTTAGQLWTDEVGGFQLQRTGGGTSLVSNAAKPNYWSI